MLRDDGDFGSAQNLPWRSQVDLIPFSRLLVHHGPAMRPSQYRHADLASDGVVVLPTRVRGEPSQPYTTCFDLQSSRVASESTPC